MECNNPYKRRANVTNKRSCEWSVNYGGRLIKPVSYNFHKIYIRLTPINTGGRATCKTGSLS